MKRKISKRQLYEQIMKVVSKELNKALNEDFSTSSTRHKKYIPNDSENTEFDPFLDPEDKNPDFDPFLEPEDTENDKDYSHNSSKYPRDYEDDDFRKFYNTHHWQVHTTHLHKNVNESLRMLNWDDIEDMLNEFIRQCRVEIDFEDISNNDIDDLMFKLKDWASNTYLADGDYNEVNRLFKIYEDDIRQWFYDECIVIDDDSYYDDF